MEHFKDDNGKPSLMRKITYYTVITALVWGTLSLIYSFVANYIGKDYDIPAMFIITVLSVGITGKAGQKIIEIFKK